MKVLTDTISFDWDEHNIEKNYEKHGVKPLEVEEIFLDSALKVVADVKHSQREKRFVALGKNFTGKVFFASFTLQGTKVRIIPARGANKKEAKFYEQKN